MDAGDWVTSAVAVVAVIISGLAAKFARDERDSARRSVLVAEDAAESSRRQAKAAERALALAEAERDEALAVRRGQLVFRLSHFGGSRFALTNTTAEDKRDVRVNLPPHVLRDAGDVAWATFKAGSTETFLCGRTQATPAAPKVEVEWYDPEAFFDDRSGESHLLPSEQ